MARREHPRLGRQHLTTAFCLTLIGVIASLQTPVRAAVSLSAVAPLGASAGVTVQITGTGFAPTAARNQVTLTVASVSRVVVGTSIVVVNPSTGLRRLAIVVPTGLPMGTASIQVRNLDTGEVGAGRTLDIVEISVSPSVAAARGTTGVALRIVGSVNAQFVAGRTTLQIGSGVTVTSTQVISASEISATVAVSATAALGPRTITVASSSQTLRSSGGFSVIEAPPTNRPPVAAAGPDQTLTVRSLAQLDGSASTDPDGNPITFAWSFASRPAGSTAILVNPTAANPTFVIDLPGTYDVDLVVSDGTLQSPSDRVTISTMNSPPVANAGADTSAFVQDIVTLNGSGSSDVDGNTLTYAWTLIDAPSGSGTSLSQPTAVNPTLVIDVAGVYVLQLIVNDGLADSGPDTMTITTLNSRPVANAGADILPVVGTSVQLDGSASTDIDGQPLTFLWSLTTTPAGSVAALSDPHAVKATFNVDLQGTYIAQLIVNDGALDSLPDTVTVATQNRAPIANPGQAQSVAVGSTVQLDGSASTDPDGNAITFRWSLTSAPSGSTVVLSDTTSPTPAFVADLFGDYIAQLIVNDGSLDSAPQTVTISTNNSVPIANAGADQFVATGVTVQLDGSGSSDPDGTPLQTSWSLTTRPAGSGAVLSNTGIVNPTFVADVDGTFVAQLIVGDGVLLSTPDTVAITAAPGADLAVSFYQAASNPAVGSSFEWGISVNNLGPANTSDVRVRAAFPAGYTFTAKNVPVGSYDEATGIWTIGPMAPGAGANLAIFGIVNGTGPYDLTATVIESSAPDPNLANNTGTHIVTPDANADVLFSFFAVDTAPPVGSTQVWTIQVQNLGPGPTTGVTVHAPLPGGYTLITPAPTAGTTYDASTGIWSIGSLASSGSSILFITYSVKATGPYDLTASITHSDAPDPNLANNTITRVVTPNPNADLALSFFAAADTPPVGSTQTWGMQVHNGGPAVATVARIHAPLPAGYTFLSANMSVGTSYDVATGIWTISPPATTNGSGLGINYRVNATGPYDLVASIIESDRPDPNLANNTRTVVVTPNPNADLRVDFLNFSPGTRPPGEIIAMLFDVNNAGPADASNVVAEFKIPAGFTITSVSVGRGTYDNATGVWTIGELPFSSLARLVVAMQVNATGPVDLRAAITSSSAPDPNLANNVLIPARINRPPVANAGVDQSASTNALVNLDGSASFDADGDPITFAWTPALRPINSAATLSAPTAAATSFTPDLPGSYVAQLIVRDSLGVSSAPDLVAVSTTVTNSPPAIVTGPVTAAAVAQPYQYDVNAIDPNLSDVLVFSLTTAPSGMTIDSASGLISWVPATNQAGQQSVLVRVQDGGGLSATQSFAVQVSSSGNGQPVSVDDAYEVRVGESLSVSTPGVFVNDTDESPLTARLAAPPGNGTALLNADGSFTYTPHTLQPGEFVLAENVNLAARIPGVTVFRAAANCPRCAIDEDVTTKWEAFGGPIEIVFPASVTVSQVKIAPSSNPNDPRISAGIFELIDGAGVELYDSGPVDIPGPSFNATLVVPQIPGVRRVRFTPTASPTSLFFATLAEVKVIGSGLIRREPFVEPNLVQLLPATVTASSEFIGNVKESLTDDSEASNWFSNGNAGDFIEVTFPVDVTVSELRAANPSGRPDGFGTSLGIECSGTFVFLDSGRNVLFSSGLVNEPFGSLHPSDVFTLNVPNLTGVRHIRYTVSGCVGNFPAGFSEWRVIGSADVQTPAFGLGEKFQSLQGREAHSTPIVVNLTDDNGDGAIDANDIPDIVVPVEAIGDQLKGEIKAISGDDGRELFTAGGPNLVSPWSELAAADIDGDGMPEIIAVHSDGSHLIAFEHTGVQKWISDANPMPSFNIGAIVYTGAISIANLDGAGPPEIIVGASVFDADGHLLGDGRTLSGTTGGVGLRSAISAIGDIDLDGQPELVAGPTVYRLNGSQLTKVWQRADRPDGYIGIANLDDDPQAEIVSVANGVVYVLNHDGSDEQGWNAPTHTPVAIPGGGQGGAPLIVDVDGDGRPEIGVAAASHFVLFNRDGGIRWMSAISDRTSNSTGAVAFDLNGDGEVEIIYRDEFFLRIYRGADGVLLSKTLVGSATWSEEPVVADVDNDGHADIIVASDFFRQTAEDTGIIVFQDVANKWKRTRRIWNQHSYHVTNVNEDATIPLNESAHWLIPGLNAFRTNAFVPGESEDETDSFTYVASDGVLDSNVATVRIAIRTPNSGPQITSTPTTSAADGVSYSYAAQAVDPDAGDILTFSLPTAPAGMSIDPASGLVEWIPTAGQQGVHDVVVKVADVRGLYALQGYQVTVATALTVPDIIGQLQSAAESAITSASLAIGAVTTRHSAGTLQGVVVSQNPAAGSSAAAGTPVSFVVSLGPPPVGTVPNVVGLTQTSAQQDVTAAGFNNTVTGQNNSLVPVGLVMSQNPAGGTIAPATTVVSLVVSLGPPPGEIDLDLDGFTGNQGDCNDTNAAINPFAVDTPGDGIDQNCNGVDSIVGDTTFPVALIESPVEDAEISMPTDIVGTATDANFLRYRVLAASVEDDVFTEIAQGASPATSGVLGQFDPTLRENGMYRVRLVVEDVNGQTTVDERVYRVTGTAKVGVFSLAFVDLQAPFSGIPITVVRTYDSRVKTQRDFGIGWSLQVKTGTYQNNRRPGDGWTITTAPGPFGLPCTVASEMRSHLTEIRLSEREFYIFRPKLTGLAAVVGGCVGSFTYEFVKGPYAGATLQVIGGSDFIYTSGDVLTHFDGGADTGLIFNPLRVRLRTADTRVIDLESRAGITRIQDSNDNTLDIGSGGVVHSSGRSIAFTRDALGRIIRITDLRGFPLLYTYDGQGDLIEFTDQASSATTFTYDINHLLLEIHDAEGNRAIRSEYDGDGRLVAVIDAKGIRTEFDHDLAARSEVVRDGLGHETQVIYDDLGNVRSTVKTVTIDGVAVPATTQYDYDANGNETVIVDADNRRIENVWDTLGNQLSAAIDPAGLNLRRQFTYTVSGYLLTETDPNGEVHRFTVDARTGNATSWMDVDGRSTAVAYDRSGNVTRTTDPNGRATQLSYDTAGRPLSRTDALGQTATYTYDAVGNKLTETATRTVDGVLRQLTTRFEYDARNRLTRTVDPLGRSTQMAYDSLGRQISMTDAAGRTTTYEYDAIGDLVKTSYPDGTTELRQYDDRGDMTQVTNREGLVTRHQYDELRQLVKTTLPTGAVARYVYSAGGRQLATIAPDGARTDYEYDAAGRRLLKRGPAVPNGPSGPTRPEWHYEYDAGNRLVAEVDPLGHRREIVFDTAARRVTGRLPDGTEASEIRDQWGRPIRRIDQEGRAIDFSYVADTGWLSSVTMPPPAAGQSPVSWQFEYDEAGKRTSQIDPLGRKTRFAYDEVGRLRRITLPGGEMRSLSYDAADRIAALTDYDGQTTTFEYDLADRVTRRSLPTGGDVRLTYTPGGQRATAQDARGITSYAYDTTGRLTRIDQPTTGSVEYDYDIAGRVTSIKTPGATTSYSYDALSRLVGVQGGNGVTAYQYDLAGNLTSLDMPDGIVATLAHDVRNQLTSLSYQRGATTLGTFGYSYTPDGRRATITEAGATTNLTYDQIGRLIGETRTGTSPFARQFEYDLVGNRTRTITNGLDVSSTYDANDRLLASGTVSYAYDPRGNVISRNQAGAVSTFAWTSDNRLASVTSVNGATAFTYDADGTRVAKSSAAGTIRYLVDGVNPSGLRQALEERDGGGGLLASHQFGLGLLSTSRSGVDQYALTDGQTSIRMLADATGQITDQYSFDAFGNPVATTGSTNNDHRYIGEALDAETGLYYLRERYYDPTTGRFLSRDPVDGDPMSPLSLHRYLYAGNDPVNFADPNGDFFTLIGFSVNMAVQGFNRGFELGKNASQLCKVKGFAKIIPVAMRLREFTSTLGKLEEFIERLTPTVGVGFGSTPFALSFKEVLYEHPLAKLEPPHLNGELRAVELAVSPTALDQFSLELAAVEFRNNTVKMAATCGLAPFRFISFSGTLGREVPLLELRVCGLLSAGTISGTFTATAAANGFNFSGSSVELGAKLAITFLPEIAVTIVKLPRE